MTRIYVGDVGTRIEVDTGADLTEAENALLKVKVFRQEDKWTTFTAYMDWLAIVQEPPEDGVIGHVVIAGELTEPGEYSINACVNFEDGSFYTGETAKLTVSRLFE